MKPRTNTDWSKHELSIEKDSHCLIHTFKIPDSRVFSVCFINARDILAVTGDLGNWIFSREFHPSPNGRVSDGYWLEKLYGGIYRSQVGKVFDSNEAVRNVEQELAQSDLTEEEIEYLQELSANTDDQFVFEYHAHYNPKGRYENHEGIPDGMILNPQLAAVFDAFEEVCARLAGATP